MTARLQNFRMKLTLFDYKVTYIPGKDLHTPDALSRAPLSAGKDDEDVILTSKIKSIASLQITNITEEDIIQGQRKDATLKNLREYVKNGWPENKNKYDQTIGPYFKYRKDISYIDQILVFQDRIIIPEGLREECLKEIHSGHLGINKSKSRAKQTVWWPGISGQINDMILNCEMCLKNKPASAEPLLQLEIPSLPWHTVGTDLLEWKGDTYLVIQDYYSLFLEVIKMKKTESKDIISEMKKIFARFGIPKIVRSDNGPQYNSGEFREFAQSYGFKWRPSSPKFAQSNGLAESGVKTAKKILEKSEDFHLGLLAYRNTSLSCGPSPSQLLMGRMLRERIPISERKLKPRTPNHDNVRKRKKEQKEKQKHYFNKRHGAKEKQTLKKDDRVWVTDKKIEGKVKEPAGPRSYSVLTEKGEIRRNRSHLQPLPTTTTNTQTTRRANQSEENTARTQSARARRKPTYLKDFV